MKPDQLIFFILIVSSSFLYVRCEGECIKDSDCDISRSVCKDGNCDCPGGFVLNSDRTQCLPGAEGLGGECNDSVQCSYTLKSGGFCQDGVCICEDGFHYLRGRCWKTSGLFEKCAVDENCFVSNDFESSVCDSSNKSCVCSPGYYQREYSSCRRKSGYNQPCGIALDCGYANAVCTKERICRYANETVSHFKTLKGKTHRSPHTLPSNITLQQKIIGDSCLSDIDCKEIKNAYCSEDKTCRCLTGFYYPDNKTVCYPELGSKCDSDSDCVGKNTMCRMDKKWCTCKAGFVANKTSRYCEKMSRQIGWSCLTQEECSFFGPQGECVSKKCHCSPNSHYVDQWMFCWATKKVGESCLVGFDCGSNSSVESCVSGQCKCSEGGHPSSDSETCRADSTHVGDNCVESIDCVYPHSDCINRTCACSQGYFIDNFICVPGVGGRCEEDSDCGTLKGGECDIEREVCRCKEGKVPNAILSECLDVATTYLDPCLITDQCIPALGKESECSSDGKCVCCKGYHYVSEYGCLLDVSLGDPCSQASQCVANNSVCLKGRCSCDYGFTPSNNSTLCSSEGAHLTGSIILLLFLLITVTISL